MEKYQAATIISIIVGLVILNLLFLHMNEKMQENIDKNVRCCFDKGLSYFVNFCQEGNTSCLSGAFCLNSTNGALIKLRDACSRK